MTRSPPPRDEAYDALFYEACKVMRAGESVRAEHLAREALAHDPERAAAYNLLAVVRLREGRQHEALNLLRAGLDVEPTYATARRNLADWTTYPHPGSMKVLLGDEGNEEKSR